MTRPPNRLPPLRSSRIILLLCLLAIHIGLAQDFSLTNSIRNGTNQVTFQSRSDSYYILFGSSALPKLGSVALPPPLVLGVTTNWRLGITAVLGNGGVQSIQFPFTNSVPETFYRAGEYPISSPNNITGDGIPDGWQLQHGLNPLDPRVGTNFVPGLSLLWTNFYHNLTNLDALPLAQFQSPNETVIVGTPSVSIPIVLSKPYTGWVTFVLSGTALQSSTGVTGDYVAPKGKVYCNNSTQASIPITLVPQTDIGIDRTIVIALSTAPVGGQTYTITSNSCVTTVKLLQSLQGVYFGNLSFTNGVFSASQSVKMALRPGPSGSTVALLNVAGNAIFGNTFIVSAATNGAGFQLGSAQTTVTNTPWGRDLGVNLMFQPANQSTDGSYVAPVTISLTGLTASGLVYSGSGNLSLALSQ